MIQPLRQWHRRTFLILAILLPLLVLAGIRGRHKQIRPGQNFIKAADTPALP